MNELFDTYLEELKEILLQCDESLIKIQRGEFDLNTINSIFRVAHTIKGNSAGMEFFNIEKLMHHMEDLLQEIREGKRELNNDMVKMLFICHDFIEDAVKVIEETRSDKSIDVSVLISNIEKLKSIDISETTKTSNIQPVKINKDIKNYHLPTADPELISVIIENCKMGYNAYRLFIEFSPVCQMKNVRVWMVFEKVDTLSTFVFSSPERPDAEDFKNGTYEFEGECIEIYVISDKDIDVLKNDIQGMSDITNIEFNNLEIEWLESEKARIQSEKKDNSSTYELNKTTKEQPLNKDVIKENAFIRIPINRVDSLMDTLGELLILNAQIEQKVSSLGNEDLGLNNVLARSAKLIRGIQDASMSLRMIEIKPTLHRLTRIARDTAAELNKKIIINIEGEETEIDRSASEKLFDPLMHLIRNAVSHGIEAESDRIKLGKPPEGKITLRVYSKRGNVYIEVEDDGNGINSNAVYQKAKKQGLVIEGKDYTEEEIIKFIFHPGFSTQEVINTISGRGVGMNVVESEINKMGGKVEIINKEGLGATFVVRIPMKLAVVNGTIVELSGGRYIVPTLFIKEFFIPKKENWVSMQGKNKAIKVRDNIIPIVTGKDIFGIETQGGNLEDKNIIILELEQKYLALPVDKILSRQEIVSKPLDKEFSSVGFASGVSILGDGKVSVILDVEAMFKMIHN
jgi:two-component system chemotaxis sensor kinase CheA